MKRLALVPPPNPIEQKYAQAIDEIQGRIVHNPLFEKSLETPRDAAVLLDKIVRFFYYENSDYLNEDIDYKNSILEALSELHTFLSRGSIDHIYQMYANFETSGDITSEMLHEKSKELFASIGKNDLPKFLKILFSPFETLAGYREETFHGTKKLQEFSAYARIFGRGLLYPEHRVTGITRPAAGTSALTSLLPEERDTSSVIGRISMETHSAITGAPISLGSNVIPITSQNTTEANAGGVYILAGEGLVRIPEDVEKIVSGGEFVQDIREQIHAPNGESQPSEAEMGKLRRRNKDRNIRIKKDQLQEKQRNQEWYNGELERLQSLSAFLHERFEELRNHLNGSIPYILEVLDYLSLVDEIDAKGYEIDSTAFREIQSEQKRRIGILEQHVKSLEMEIGKLEGDVVQLGLQLAQTPDEKGATLLSKKIKRKEGRIARNKGNIALYNSEIKKEKRGIGGLVARARSHRFTQVPNQEEFSLAFHHSLRAQEVYSAPEWHPEIPVSRKWIDENVIPLFVKILGTYLHEYHDVNIRDLYELMRKIDELPEEYSNTVILPDTDRVSQKNAGDFFSMLIPIIPKDYLAEIPDLPIIITPEGTYSPKVLRKKELKPRKTHREIREATISKKTEIDEKRGALLEQMQKKEGELMEYEQYWREKLVKNIRTRRAYFTDIEKIDHKLKLRRSYPNKTKDELEALIQASKVEEEEIRQRIANGELRKDESSYRKLIDNRAELSRKLARLR